MRELTKRVTFRFYAELNDFIPPRRRRGFQTLVQSHQTVKDAVESFGVPHAEIDLILANGHAVSSAYRPEEGDRIAVYPVFESFNIARVTRVRRKPLRHPRFILDVHLGKLARNLRMAGFDSYYGTNLEDAEIIEISLKQKRIILTRDRNLLKNNRVTHGFWIRSQDPKRQMKEVLKRLDLFEETKPFSRCLECNGLLRRVTKKTIQKKLLPDTRKYHRKFSQCGKCAKIYWQGSHYMKMKKFLFESVKKPANRSDRAPGRRSGT